MSCCASVPCSRRANAVWPRAVTRLRELRIWQAARLARTYDDLRRDPYCADAIAFFVGDLCGLADHTRRDQDLARAAETLKRTLPQGALEVLGSALELQMLTAQLDQAMVAQLGPGPLSWPTYAAAYRAVDRAAARKRQIEIVLEIGQDLEHLVRREWIALALRAARIPVQLAGFGALHDFLDRTLRRSSCSSPAVSTFTRPSAPMSSPRASAARRS